MSDCPTVSVVIPVYNRKVKLERSIQSVLDQTFDDFELIIVDDGSTDGTDESVKALDDPRIRFIRSEVNEGASAARNRGIELARGEFIAFQDSDDTWVPEKLAKQIDVFRKQDDKVGVVYCGCLRTYQGKTQIFPPVGVPVKSGTIYDVMLRGNLVTTQTAVIRQSALKKVGLFNPKFLAMDDWEFFLRFSRHYEFVYVDETLCSSEIYEDSLTLQHENWINGCLMILDLYKEDYKKDRKLRAQHLGAIADRCYRSGFRGKGLELYFRAMCVYPLRVTHLAGFILGLLGAGVYEKCTDAYFEKRVSVS